MNKEFTTYNQALALKELGFDEPCFGFYPKSGGNIQFGSLGKFSSEYTHIISAPTYSQAFRWFREKNNLYGLIDYMLTPNMAKYKILKENDLVIEIIMAFGEYEEAENACLNKLIKICKNKTND